MATKSELFRSAFFYQGTHAMSGSQLHKLLAEGKDKEAAAQHKETQQRESELLKRLELKGN